MSFEVPLSCAFEEIPYVKCKIVHNLGGVLRGAFEVRFCRDSLGEIHNLRTILEVRPVRGLKFY